MDEVSDESAQTMSVFFPKEGTLCTEPFGKFLTEFRSHADFFFFICHIVARVDENRVVAAKALLPSARDEADKRRYEESISKPDIMMKELQKHSKILSQNLTNGIVNSFQRYFSSIIQCAALKNPLVISSSQTVKVDDVLKFTKHRDLISFIVDRKINELSYGGLADMEKYFHDRLGIKMFTESSERELLRLFFESRNINVHNGGVVNEIFTNRVGKVDGFSYKFGKVFHIDLDDLAALSANAMKVALEIDKAVGTKFKLRRKTFKAWKGVAEPRPKA